MGTLVIAWDKIFLGAVEFIPAKSLDRPWNEPLTPLSHTTQNIYGDAQKSFMKLFLIKFRKEEGGYSTLWGEQTQ